MPRNKLGDDGLAEKAGVIVLQVPSYATHARLVLSHGGKKRKKSPQAFKCMPEKATAMDAKLA
jgi:hypothetical protein